MKTKKIIYWISSIVFCLFMAFSGFNGLSNLDMKLTFAHLGFPDYFRIELFIGKIIGIFLLLTPNIPLRFKGWTYAGFGILLISASIAHAAVGDSIGQILGGIIFFIVLLISYTYMHKINQHNKIPLAK